MNKDSKKIIYNSCNILSKRNYKEFGYHQYSANIIKENDLTLTTKTKQKYINSVQKENKIHLDLTIKKNYRLNKFKLKLPKENKLICIQSPICKNQIISAKKNNITIQNPKKMKTENILENAEFNSNINLFF